MMKPKTMAQCSQALLDCMKRGDHCVGFIFWDEIKKEFSLAWAGSIRNQEAAELLLREQLPFSKSEYHKTSVPE